MTKVEVCLDCQKWHQVKGAVLLKNTALYAYDEAGRKFMELFKFVGDTRVTALVIKELRQELLGYQKKGYVLCPLPSSEASLKKREFETIPTLVKQCSVTTVSLLEHIGSGKKQSEKTRQERLQLKQPFRVKEGVLIPKKVLLVDDVYTTGATIHLAAKALKEMGVEEVESLTLFR
ncbi:phosphoribosyltransferase family protein [uncultured Granulicatella sp.]|uniref:ComF family protein n=1 Tax=uncultured Granulicatella sp. TaxID=316089 RepID=UPI00260E706B|nr:phosphoribosyltransferase family protein [uncultured Granulicatella sp.]